MRARDRYINRHHLFQATTQATAASVIVSMVLVIPVASTTAIYACVNPNSSCVQTDISATDDDTSDVIMEQCHTELLSCATDSPCLACMGSMDADHCESTKTTFCPYAADIFCCGLDSYACVGNDLVAAYLGKLI